MLNNIQTSNQQTSPNGEAKWTSSQAASLVSRFQMQENGEVRKMIVTSGQRCLEQFEKSNPDGSWVKTFSALLIGMPGWYSSRSVLTWKLRATKSNRTYFQLAVSTHRTADTEHSLLPTAQTQGLKTCNKEGKTEFLDLSHSMLLTPTSTCISERSEQALSNRMKYRQSIGRNTVPPGNLSEQIHAILKGASLTHLLPTPTTQEVEHLNATITATGRRLAASGNSHSLGLADLAIRNILPTPKNGDYRTGTPNRLNSEHTQGLNDTIAYQTGKSSQLNPLFVEEMMGFPIYWTLMPFVKAELRSIESSPSPDGERNP